MQSAKYCRTWLAVCPSTETIENVCSLLEATFRPRRHPVPLKPQVFKQVLAKRVSRRRVKLPIRVKKVDNDPREPTSAVRRHAPRDVHAVQDCKVVNDHRIRVCSSSLESYRLNRFPSTGVSQWFHDTPSEWEGRGNRDQDVTAR